MNIKHIVDNNQCLHCGICKSRCPVNAIAMAYNQKSGYFYVSVDDGKCTNCGSCNSVCPAESDKTEEDPCDMIGPYDLLLLAHSESPKVRHDSTSGGIINELVRYLVEKSIVDAVLVVREDTSSPIESSTYILTKSNINALTEFPRDFSSRYTSVPVLENIYNYAKNKKIAVVGTPCQIEAISRDRQLRENVLCIGIACSGGMSYLATSEYKRKMNFRNSSIFYRGDGWPGNNCLISDADIYEVPHPGSLFERMFTSQIFKNPGCKWCCDQFAEYADISFCDFWNREETKTEHEGNSCVIIRSKKLEHFVKNMASEKRISIVRELTAEEVSQSQRVPLLWKKTNVMTKFPCRLFYCIVEIVFKTRLYRCFHVSFYNLLCKLYYKAIGAI